MQEIICYFYNMVQDNSLLINEITKYEKRFSGNSYNGNGSKDFLIKEGFIPIMISAPHSVNQFREGKIKYAEKFTGAIAYYLHHVTGCHVIYSTKYNKKDPNYDPNPNGENRYQTQLKNYLLNHTVYLLIDLHGASNNRDFAIEMGTAPMRNQAKEIVGEQNPSLHGKDFVCDLIKYTFNFFFRDIRQPNNKKDILRNIIFDAGGQNTVTKYISDNTSVSCIQLEINGIYRSPENSEEFCNLVRGLSCLINILGKINWNASKIKAYRIWQSSSHKPQDKIVLDLDSDSNSEFKEVGTYSICSFFGRSEMIKIKSISNNSKHQLQEHINSFGNNANISDYLFLTNRLIELVCGREWIQDGEGIAYLQEAPIVLYENNNNIYQIGLPKANQINYITFSSHLYSELKPLAIHNNFILFNRYTDSRYYIDFSKADYMDYGRVKDSQGMPAKKIMIPRYYRRLLGYLDEPLPLIQKEEYSRLVNRIIYESIVSFMRRVYISETSNAFKLLPDILKKDRLFNIITNSQLSPVKKEDFLNDLTKGEYEFLLAKIQKYINTFFSKCYEKMHDEDFYKLKSSVGIDYLNTITDILKLEGVYDYIELLQIPKKKPITQNIFKKVLSFFHIMNDKLLNLVIGKSEYLLKTVWTTETDDKNNVVRLSPNIMSLLGVSKNDKILVYFGEKKEKFRVLDSDTFSDYQIGIPAPARKKLGMNSINDIVLVHRDMKHTFWRNSHSQIIAILGTILAVFQVSSDYVYGLILCIVFIPIIMALVLNEERIKVK